MTINDLKTGMIVQRDNCHDYYVVYKDAVPIYSSSELASDNYLVSISDETVWSSTLANIPLNTQLQTTNINKVWAPNFPYYTGQTAIDAIKNKEPIWTKKEGPTEMTLEQICEALGKDIKIIKG